MYSETDIKKARVIALMAMGPEEIENYEFLKFTAESSSFEDDFGLSENELKSHIGESQPDLAHLVGKVTEIFEAHLSKFPTLQDAVSNALSDMFSYRLFYWLFDFNFEMVCEEYYDHLRMNGVDFEDSEAGAEKAAEENAEFETSENFEALKSEVVTYLASLSSKL